MSFGFISIADLAMKDFDGLEEVKNYERRETGTSEYTELFRGVLSKREIEEWAVCGGESRIPTRRKGLSSLFLRREE